jgi:4'-phosphopantetheinyl transferase
MGLLQKKELEEGVVLGLWQIEEEYDNLLTQIDLSKQDIERLDSFQNYHRKLEFLSVRALLKELNPENYTIVYNGNRKPHLSDNSKKISISHSHEYTSILLSKHKKIGIDLEFMSHKIQCVAHKFINSQEKITSDPSLQLIHMYIHWCAKEALYKICDKQDINFRKNLTLLPFEPLDFGTIIGYVDNKFGHEEFNIHYYTLGNYVIAYTCK